MSMKPLDTNTMHWNKKASDVLEGRRITKVMYMSAEDAETLGWHSRGLVLVLDNGVQVMPQSDDEGNNAGALWAGSLDGETVLPVL